MTEPREETQRRQRTEIDTLKYIHHRMEAIFTEINAFRISPRIDYGRVGVEKLHKALVATRSYADRSNALAAEARFRAADAESAWKQVDFLYQMVYDELSVAATKADDRHSWEERASRIRTLALDEAILRRQAEDFYLVIKGLSEAVDLRARGIDRASMDLGRQTDVLKFAHQLGELS